MDTLSEVEKRIAREQRKRKIAENAAHRKKAEMDAEARADKRFHETRDLFHKNIACWNEANDQPAKSQTLRVHRDALHTRLLWDVGDALNWRRHGDGTYYLDAKAIDGLHKPMALLLQFVKAEHKIAHDRATLALRERQANHRAAKVPAPKEEEKIAEIAERPHTPELSA